MVRTCQKVSLIKLRIMCYKKTAKMAFRLWMFCSATYSNRMTDLIEEFIVNNTQKRPSAETQYDNKVEAPAIDYKNIPMIKFLREKGEKKIAEKRSLRRSQAAGVLLNVAGKGKGGPGKGDRGSSGGSKGTGGTAGSGSGSASSSVKVGEKG